MIPWKYGQSFKEVMALYFDYVITIVDKKRIKFIH
jgi:hypothetical protein